VAFVFAGIEESQPAPGVVESLLQAQLVIICPSNPWVSIDPILTIPGLHQLLEKMTVIAVSPIIAGKTVKGPAAKMFAELGIDPTALAVAEHYGQLLTGFIIDQADGDQAEAVQALGIRPSLHDTWMKTPSDRRRLAREVLNFAMGCLK
jgi:LPPG:FO 2-phospho-L-lactate transferase